MQTQVLAQTAKICSRISNQSSIQPLYRSIEIGVESIRCCSEFGNIQIDIDKTGLNEACLLDTIAVLSVASSLPQDGDIELTKTDSRVNWKCGEARGHLNIVASDHAIPKLNHQDYPWTPDKQLADALRLSSCACQAAAVSVGLYGITLLIEGDKLHLLSSNSISLASVKIDKGGFPVNEVTVRPPVPAIIAALIQSCPNCVLDITDMGIFVMGDWLAAHLPISVKLEHDLTVIANQYTGTKHTAKINNQAVKKFITRARALTDRNASFLVELGVETGKLVLKHSGMASATEEYFLAEGIDPALQYNSVKLPADMVLLPLENIEFAVFDYLNSKRLVLRGTNPEFVYVVDGQE